MLISCVITGLPDTDKAVNRAKPIFGKYLPNGEDPLFICQSKLKRSLNFITWRRRLRAQPQVLPELLGIFGDGSRSCPWLPGMEPWAVGGKTSHLNFE